MAYTPNLLRRLFRYQFVKFLFVGGLNTVFGYGCFALFLYAGLHYTLALFLSTAFGIMFNFKSLGFLVFSSRSNQLIFRFIGTYFVIYLINATGIAILSAWGYEPRIGGAILIFPMAVLAFILNKRFVFNYV